jgi:hypothetical protein
MSYYVYRQDNIKAGWRLEGTTGSNFRDADANSTLDETNAAGATMYAIPLVNWTAKILRVKRNKTWTHIAGSVDWGHLAHAQFEELEWEIEGELQNFCWMYPLTGIQPTNAGANPYSHIILNTTARSAFKPSIEILFEFTNDTDAQTLHMLLVGTIVNKCRLSAGTNEKVHAVFTLQTARIIAGTTLSSWPAIVQTTNSPYHIGETSITFNKGGTAYYCSKKGFFFEWDDGSQLFHAAGSLYATEPLLGPRKITAGVDLLPKEKALYDDIDGLAPGTASDVDLKFDLVTTASTRSLTIDFEKVWHTDGNWDGWFNNFTAQSHHEFVLKPTAFETGAKLTITEYNDLPATHQGYYHS